MGANHKFRKITNPTTLPGITTAGFIGADDIMAGDNYGVFSSKKRFTFYDNDVIRNNLAGINVAFFFSSKKRQIIPAVLIPGKVHLQGLCHSTFGNHPK